MMKHALIPALWLVATSLSTAAPLGAQSLTEQVAERLRVRLEAAGSPPAVSVGEEVIWSTNALPAYYERVLYRPAWSDDGGPLPRADQLVQAIGEAQLEGLRPGDYHLERIRLTLGELRRGRARGQQPEPGHLVDLDLLLTDAFLLYGSHLLLGRVNPETIHAEWKANRRGADLATELERAIAADAPAQALRDLLPRQAGYARLREALRRHRRVAAAGGWTPIPPGPTLSAGVRDERVVSLRRRLELGGDLAPPVRADPGVFDDGVEQAVRRFQARHGLDPTGIVDSGTVAALNVPAEERVRQLELNLERWRWLPEDLGRRHLVVNIPGYDLRVVEDDRTVLEMRVMVGRTYRRTPVFSDTVRYLVFSPYWHVPHNIAVRDILPQIRRNRAYLARQRFTVFQGWGGETRLVDPATVDWSSVSAATFPYRFRQDPGSQNALGRVKFMFPNRYNVYLHDTPATELFDRPDRDFSSGCIRVERPLELAAYLLADRAEWTPDRIRAAMNRGVEQTVPLTRPVPVHVEYWTAWTTEDGRVHFRRDLYGRDQQLATALGEPPPRAAS